MVRTRPYLPQPGAQVLTVEDWGVGMSAVDLADANDLLDRPRDVDLATSQRLGLHVVARLAGRYGISTALEATPGGGVTAVVVLPAALFADRDAGRDAAGQLDAPLRRTPVGAGVGRATAPAAARTGWPLAGAGGSGPDAYAGGSGGYANGAGPGAPELYANGSGPDAYAHPAGPDGYGTGARPLPGPLPDPRGTGPEPPPAVQPAAPAAGDWTSWWPLPPGTTGRTTSSPTLEPLPGLGADPDLPGPEADPDLPDLGLTRRTPQANLADELRRTGDPTSPAAPPATRPAHPERDPERARSALSRFQASQRAAREDERRAGQRDGEGRP
jgi:hypothetical protein